MIEFMDETNATYRDGIVKFLDLVIESTEQKNEDIQKRKYRPNFYSMQTYEKAYSINRKLNGYLDQLHFDFEGFKIYNIMEIIDEDTGNSMRAGSLVIYDTLSALCDFFRLAERCLCYNNDLNTGFFYVDSEFMPKNGERAFAITKELYTIYGKLYIRKDEINNISYKVKNLRIVHHNGKKLTTDITIVNGNFKEKQLGDSAMLKMVYDDITECIYRSYKQVFQNIIDRRERLLREKYGEDIIFDYKTID